MTPAEIAEAKRRELSRLALLSLQWDAARRAYDAACFMGDKQEIQHQRQLLHSILDFQLDSVASQLVLARLEISV